MAKAKMSGGKGGKSSGTSKSAGSFNQKLGTDKGIGIGSTLEKAATNPYKGYTPGGGGDPLVGNGGGKGGAETYEK
jgi:hypothetical protein